LSKFVARFTADEAGTTAIEYGMIAGLIVIVIVSAVGALGTQLLVLFNSVVNAFPA
jgi:pilus assembly protein Flp/PilA